MSFLIRRNLPLAWAGWYDDFTTYSTGLIQRPWVHLGDGGTADITEENWLHIPSNAGTINGGGESYAYQPFTPNWGIEVELWYPVEGLAAQAFAVYFTDSWTAIGGAFQNCVGVRLLRAVAAGGEQIQFVHFHNPMSFDEQLSAWSSPVTFMGQWHTLQIWCENDNWIRIWLNGTYIGSQMIRPGFRLGPRRRCVRFLDGAFCDAWIRRLYHYDRPASIPPMTVWQQDFYDDFNGRSGNQNGVNGWTQFGTGAGVVADSFAPNGAADSRGAILRDTGNSSGRVRVEATVGGSTGPNGTRAGSIILCGNAAGDQGLAAHIWNNRLHVERYSTSIGVNPTWTTLQDLPTSFGVSVATGDRVAFSVYNGIGWVEVNGVPQLCVGWMHGVVPASNSYVGVSVGRTSDGVYSNSWNDIRIYSGLG